MVDTEGKYWTLVNACRPGPTGSDSTAADTGAWVTATTYNENDRCTHARGGYGQSVYRAKSTHLSAATSEPEVGATWDTYWELWASGGADGAGDGDALGVASSVANRVVTFSDTGGKQLKMSAASENDILFNGLTAMSADIDPATDYVKVYDASGVVYQKALVKKIHRKTETISLMANGMYPRSDYLPSGAIAGADLPTTRFWLKHIPFSKDVVSYANCSFIMPESWDGGSLTAIFWGTTATASAGTVRMAISARVVADGESCDVAGPALVATTMTMHEAAYKMVQSNALSFTPTAYSSASLAGGNKILFQICRYGIHEDTLDEDFWLTDVVIRYGVGDD